LISVRNCRTRTEITFAPRVKVPTLMVNGRYDHFFRWRRRRTSCTGFWGHLRRTNVTQSNGGHIPNDEVAKEILDWLDKYQGREMVEVGHSGSPWMLITSMKENKRTSHHDVQTVWVLPEIQRSRRGDCPYGAAEKGGPWADMQVR
jgi:hypothetical protein